MNFLAHLYLSGEDSEIMIGNFIADSVKGRSYNRFKPKIQQGILLHRKIDSYTDKHKITRELSTFLRPGYNKHSGIVIDIFYDHFLSINWEKFAQKPLTKYIRSCHRILLRNILILPSDIKGFLPILIARRRLQSYSKIEGIENVLELMSKYTSLPASSQFAIEILKENYLLFNAKFLEFFEDLILMVDQELRSQSELVEPDSI